MTGVTKSRSHEWRRAGDQAVGESVTDRLMRSYAGRWIASMGKSGEEIRKIQRDQAFKHPIWQCTAAGARYTSKNREQAKQNTLATFHTVKGAISTFAPQSHDGDRRISQ